MADTEWWFCFKIACIGKGCSSNFLFLWLGEYDPSVNSKYRLMEIEGCHLIWQSFFLQRTNEPRYFLHRLGKKTWEEAACPSCSANGQAFTETNYVLLCSFVSFQSICLCSQACKIYDVYAMNWLIYHFIINDCKLHSLNTNTWFIYQQNRNGWVFFFPPHELNIFFIFLLLKVLIECGQWPGLVINRD